MLTPGTLLQNRYRIASLLGQGGMGAVYLAWDMRLNIPVAVKEMIPQPGLDPQTLAQLRQQFYQEAQVLARLDHPNLVRVTDYFEEWGNAYLVMNFVEGQSLADMIAARGPLPEAQVLDWARQLLDALAYCHAQGVVHRDIKPQNIIIRADGHPILVDFGLVKLWDPRDPRTRTVVRAMGTPEYAPPEQWGAGHTDPRSDLYSLGATLYHALTGQAPATATDRTADPRILAPPRSINPSLRPETERAILRAMELAKDARWGSAAEMAAALGAPAAAPKPAAKPAPPQPTRAVPGAPPPAPPARVRIPGWAWALAGLALLLLALCGLWVLGPMRPMPTPAPMPIPLPVLAGTPVPQPVAATSPENADRVVQLARWSQDRVSNEDLPGWSPQGTWLFVPSTMGVRLYSNDDFTNYRLIETGKHPTFSPDEKFIASAVNPPGTIRLTDVQSGDMVKEWRPHDAAITDLWFRGDILFSRDENDVLVANDFTADPPAELLRTQVGDGEIFTLSDGSTLIEVDTDLTQQPPTQRLQICRVSENRCESGTNVDMGLDGLLLGISPDFTENQGSVVIWKNNGEVVAQNAFGQEISTLGIYTDTTTLPNVRISPHGKYVVIGNEIRRIQDGQVIATGETLANQLGQDYPVYLELASFSPDEHYLAVVEPPVDGLLLNLGDGEIYSLRPPEILSSGMTPPPTFRPDSQEVMFAVIGPGGSIRVFSTADGNVKGEIDAKSANAILRMAFTSAGDLAVLYPAELQIRSLHDGQILRTIRHNAGLDIALMEDGFYSKSDSSYDKIEYLFTPYNTQQPSRKMVFQRAPEEATGYNYTVYYSSLDVSRGFLFTFSPDHRYLIREAPHEASEGSRESIVVLYDVNHPEPIRTALPRPGGGYLSKLVFAPDSSLLAIGLEKEVILLSIPDMNIVGQQTTENEITGLAFALDGKTIAIATESAQVLLWNFERGTLERLDTQAEKNRTPTFSADGRLLAIVVPDGIQLWDVSARQLLRTLEAPDVVSLAFSPDQKLLVAGAEQDVIYLWGVR